MARWTKLGIVAGGGNLPQRLADRCMEQNWPCFCLRLDGLADAELEPGENVGIAEAGKIFRRLREEECDAVVMAGLVQRPDFPRLKPDWRGAALMPKLVKAATRGDGAILSVLVDLFEAEGFLVIGADDILGESLANAGALGALSPHEGVLADMRKAHDLIQTIGPFDVGQGAVVVQNQVLAIEAAEGTDMMLDRCAVVRPRLCLPARAGVLVKCPKPGQEMRVDLPTIGPETVRRAEAAGLEGIALAQGRSLVVDRIETIQLADDAGLFIFGYNAADLPPATG